MSCLCSLRVQDPIDEKYHTNGAAAGAATSSPRKYPYQRDPYAVPRERGKSTSLCLCIYCLVSLYLLPCVSVSFALVMNNNLILECQIII